MVAVGLACRHSSAKKTLNSCQTQRKRETNNVVNCNEPNGALGMKQKTAGYLKDGIIAAAA